MNTLYYMTTSPLIVVRHVTLYTLERRYVTLMYTHKMATVYYVTQRD